MGTASDLKEKVKQILKDRCGREYERTYCHALAASGYSNVIALAEEKFLREWEKQADKKTAAECYIVKYNWEQTISPERVLATSAAEVIVFVEEGAQLREEAVRIIGMWAENHPWQQLFYGDEDVQETEKKRETPWLKPEWSPQFLESVFYFGGVLAVRRETLKQVLKQSGEEMRMDCLGKLLAECAGGKEKRRGDGRENIGHIPYVLCHHGSFADYEKYLNAYINRMQEPVHENNEITSVIIPSKDHPEVLERNIRSLVKTTLGVPLEIIIVDNGSNEDNRRKVQRLLDELSWHKVQYIYEPMEFHFSKMCNLGAAKAEGKYLLFLNDDTEAVKEGWMEALRAQAAKKQVGAVGAKLLYPDSDKIQHAGIVNIPMGPVHKLQFRSDNNTYYFKKNRVRSNVIAVTGACLMVEKEKFCEAGGFSEELPVAFNDVDLCFSLYEKGYYNVVCNDVVLYHHESLSRGDDEAPEKLERLDGERRKLYQRHGTLEGADPYYHPYLNHEGLDTRIVPAPEEYLRGGTEEVRVKEIPPLPDLEEEAVGKLRLHKGLYVRMESVGGNFCQGYSFMAGDDNACYESVLLLENEENGKTYTGAPGRKLRQDLQDNMPDQKNVAMSGFAVKLKGLPAGRYRIGVMAKNKVTGVTYVNRCARKLQIGETY